MTGAQPPLADRIRRTLVGLKMPRAIEVLDDAIRRLERGEITALEAIDILLTEELTLRESRRIRTALVMARLSAIKTLAEFDFSFQPSLDRGRVMALAELGFVDRCETLHFLGPPGTGKSHLSIALGVEAVRAGRSVYFATLADLIGALAKAEREGVLREKIRFFRRFALLIVDEIGYLPVTPGGGNLFFRFVNARYERSAFAIGLEPMATRWLTPDIQSRLRRMWRGLRRSRRRHCPARSPSAPCQRHPDRGRKLSPAAAC
jgi:DNA replication protein DnaC